MHLSLCLRKCHAIRKHAISSLKEMSDDSLDMHNGSGKLDMLNDQRLVPFHMAMALVYNKLMVLRCILSLCLSTSLPSTNINSPHNCWVCIMNSCWGELKVCSRHFKSVSKSMLSVLKHALSCRNKMSDISLNIHDGSEKCILISFLCHFGCFCPAFGVNQDISAF